MLKDFSWSAVIAGGVAVLVGFTSSVALIFQAAQNLGATPAQTASWLWALGIGMGVTSVILSLVTRLPALIAWSTPGAAVIAGAAADGHLTLGQATGAFLLCAVAIAIAGFSGIFERLMNRLPLPLASALLVGVLSKFALDAFASAPGDPWLVVTMAAAYVAGRNFWPRWNVPLVLAVGVAIAVARGSFNPALVPLELTKPVAVMPEFSWQVAVGVALPLFLVTMASQNLPGVAAFKAHGFDPPVSRLIGWTGVANLLVAPFGGYTLNLAAITAAFCMNEDAHPDPRKRYVAAIAAGIFYGLIGVFGATVAGLLAAFPHALVLAVAGLALLGTITAGLTAATAEDRHRESAVITYLVVLSGISFGGIGSAFWGIVAGGVALGVRNLAHRGQA